MIITKKDVGCKVEFLGKDCTLTGTVLSVQNRVAKIEFCVLGKWERFTTYLPTDSAKIMSIAVIRPIPPI